MGFNTSLPRTIKSPATADGFCPAGNTRKWSPDFSIRHVSFRPVKGSVSRLAVPAWDPESFDCDITFVGFVSATKISRMSHLRAPRDDLSNFAF
jgi:hypothetical protein